MANLQEAPQSKEMLEVNTLVDSVGAKELAEMQDDPSIDITKESKENGIAQKMLDILPKGKYDINNCTFALNLFTIPGTNKRNVYISMTYPWETKNKNFFVGNIREDIGESHGINFDESLKLDQIQKDFIEEKFNELKNKTATKIETNSNIEKLAKYLENEINSNEKNLITEVVDGKIVISWLNGVDPTTLLNIYYSEKSLKQNDFTFENGKLILGNASFRVARDIKRDKVETFLMIGENLWGEMIILTGPTSHKEVKTIDTEKTSETKNSEVLSPKESNLFDVINKTERPGVKSCFENIQKNNLLQKALSLLISQWITDKNFNDYLSSERSTASIIVGKDAYRFRILWTNTQFRKEYTDYKDLVENWLCPKK